MAVDFRCEKCGKLLSVEAEPASRVKCPYCKSKVQVPAGLASLPRPQVPSGMTPSPVVVTVNGGVMDQVVYEQPDPLMNLMARLMPWIISLFCHVGILVIMAFISIVVLKPATPKDELLPPDMPLTESPGSALRPGAGPVPELAPRSLERSGGTGWASTASPIPTAGAGAGPVGGFGSGDSGGKIGLIGVAGAGGGGMGLGGGGGGGGPTAAFGIGGGGGGGAGGRVRFMGIQSSGMADHIVYLVDRSGSMLDTFADVQKELRNSIGRLTEQQSFHVIFFASGPPKENPPKRLVKADETAKLGAAKYLKEIQPQGQTDPIPAIKRAFEVLGQAPNKKGQLIFMLTDGDFPNNDEVLKEIRARNADGSVHINTILHRIKVESAMKVLQKIADENHGTFKFVEVHE